MTIIMYGVTVLRGVIQEKSSKVIEVIISNVKPFQLLMGKVLGIGLVGLTQYFIWAVLGYLIANNLGSITDIIGLGDAAAGIEGMVSAEMMQIPMSTFIYFVVYFALGCFLHSTLYAAIGSMVDNEQEANYIQTPLIMCLIIPLLIMPMITQGPDSTISVILSLFPFFTPMLMFLRISLMHPPFTEIFMSIIIMIITIVLSTYIASRIYRIGILMYGKKPSFKEIIKWLSYR